MELARLAVEVFKVTIEAAIGFALLLYLANKFQIAGLQALLAKAGI